jgi:CheY-like chemotaxis protein
LKDEFLATVSHELRTPLNAILGWSALLKPRRDVELLEKGLQVIHRNALAQSKIIEDILDVSRIITGKLRMEMKSVDLRAIISDALEAVRASATARDIQIELQGSDEPWRLVGDAERLQQVMWNLLSNAVKFNINGGRIRIRLERAGSQLSVSVEDDGKGIEPEFLPYVFDRFKQADGSTTRRYGGLGLGLAIVRHIVELHGGRVTVASPGPSQGSTFTISIPVRATIPAAEQRKAPSSPPERVSVTRTDAPLMGIRVLVVDDELDARELLELLLSHAGARVATAGTVTAAIEVLREHRPDVIVSDIGMPDEDGYSLMKRVRELGDWAEAIPALALTAYTRHEDAQQALARGFSMHLGKPVDPDHLTEAVARLARRAARGRESA